MLAIIKYNAGNIKSVQNALHRIGADSIVTDDAEQIRKADKIIFPGVGEAGSAMKYLKEKNLDKVIKNLRQPFLGICLGMQLLCSHSEESDTQCIGIFKEKVKLFPFFRPSPAGEGLACPVPEVGRVRPKVPHMGWNNISNLKSPLFKGISENSDVYFVHSYYAEKGDDTIAIADYIMPFSAALQKNNFYALQFHPEKSAGTGEKILKNFLSLPQP